MTLILFILHLFSRSGLPDLGADTHPTGIQLDGNVKQIAGDRPALPRR